MLIQCAWCQPPRITRKIEPLEDESIIDGICDSCLPKHFPTIADITAKLELVEQARYTDYEIEGVKKNGL